ncbi:MAG: tRNA lysidine(34) synthetase TilS [Bacilli bacterium]
MKDVLNNLKIITPTDKMIVGVSGGEDSMCLLHFLLNNFNKKNIIVAHVNHNIRSASASELEFVKSYCENNGVIFESTILPNDKIYSESKLRTMRYDFFSSLITKYKASYLLTAHHGDDLMETILMRLTRGSTLKGYAGIKIIDTKDNYHILRPLLNISKEMISNYIKEHNIPFVLDESNESDKYTRNRYRHHIIPELKKENKDIHKKYLSFSKELLDYYELVDNLVEKDIKENGCSKYNLTDFNKKNTLLQKKIIEKILYYNYGNDISVLTSKHVEEIQNIIVKSGNSEIHLPLNKKAVKEYNYLSIVENRINKKYINEVFNNYYENEDFVLETLQSSIVNSNYIIKLNSQDITLPIHIRSIKDGDKMVVKNLKGHKKIKDIIIDSKIPKSKREKLIVLIDNNDTILWLPGIKKSQFDKSKAEKYDIIIKYSEKVQTKEK